jgi:hypothetical protein
LPDDETLSHTVFLKRGIHYFVAEYKLPNGRVIRRHEKMLISPLVKNKQYIPLEFSPPDICWERKWNDNFPPLGRRWFP